MKINKKKKLIFALIIMMFPFSAYSAEKAKDIPGAGPGAMRLKGFPEIPGLIIAYPDDFEPYDVEVIQNLYPDEYTKEHKIKLIFFAVNKIEKDVRIAVQKSEYKSGADLRQSIEEMKNEMEKRGAIFKMEINSIKNNSAVTEATVITGQYNVAKSKSKIYLITKPNKQNAEIYQISIGASFNNYYKYLPAIDAVIQNSGFDLRR